MAKNDHFLLFFANFEHFLAFFDNFNIFGILVIFCQKFDKKKDLKKGSFLEQIWIIFKGLKNGKKFNFYDVFELNIMEISIMV